MEKFNDYILKHERYYLNRVLKETKFNISEALKISGLGRPQFYRIIERTGVSIPDYGSKKRPFKVDQLRNH